MSATAGRRRPDGTLPHDMEPGDYALTLGGDAVWLCSPAGDPGRVEVPTWTVVVEADGTLTVDPSIWWDKHATPPGWHGFLRRGEWTEA